MKKIKLLLLFICFCGYIYSQSNTAEYYCNENDLKIPLANKDLVDKSLYKQFIKGNEFTIFPINEGNLFRGEDYKMLDTLYSIDSIQCAINYKLKNNIIDVYEIFYRNGFSEDIFTKIAFVMKNAHNINPFFEYFKRGNILFLDKKRDCVIYIIYNATQPITQKEIDNKFKILKSQYDKVLKFP